MPLKLLLAVAPLLLSMLFGWLVMDGRLNFGDGDKEVLLAAPLLFWSLAYLCCYVTLWWRRSTLGRTLALSASIDTGFLVLAWLDLFGVVWLQSRQVQCARSAVGPGLGPVRPLMLDVGLLRLHL